MAADDQNEQREFQRATREHAKTPQGQQQVADRVQRRDEKMLGELAGGSVLPNDQTTRILDEIRNGKLGIQDASKQTDDLAEQFFTESIASGMSGQQGPMDIFKAMADDPFINQIHDEKAFADDPVNRYGGKALVESAKAAGVKDPEEFSNQLQMVAALPGDVRNELTEFTAGLNPDEKDQFRSVYFRQLDYAIEDMEYSEAVGHKTSKPRDPLFIEDNDGNLIPWASASPDQRAQVTFEKGDIEQGEYRQWFVHPDEAEVWQKFAAARGEDASLNPGSNLLYTREQLGNVIAKKDSLFTKLKITGLVSKGLALLPDAVTDKLAAAGELAYNSEFFVDMSVSDIDDAFAHPLRTLEREDALINQPIAGAVESIGWGAGALINDTFNAATGDTNFSHVREYVDYAAAEIDRLGGYQSAEAWGEYFKNENSRINLTRELGGPAWADPSQPLRFMVGPSALIPVAKLGMVFKLGAEVVGNGSIKIPIAAFSKMSPETSYRIAGWWAAKAAPRAEMLKRLQSEVGSIKVPQFTNWLNAPVKGDYISNGSEVLYRGVDEVANITPANPLANGQQLAGKTVVNLTPAHETAAQFATENGDILMVNVKPGLKFIDTGSKEYDKIIETIVNSPEYAALQVGEQQAFRDSVLEGLGYGGQVVHKQGHPILRLFDQSNAIVLGSRKLDGPLNSGNKMVEHLRSIEDVAKEVVTREQGNFFSVNTIIRGLVGRTGINPSILRYTPVGKLVTAFMRQTVAIDALTANAMSHALDSHAQRWSGRLFGTSKIGAHLFQIDDVGNIAGIKAVRDGLSRNWNDVFRNPDNYLLSVDQRALVDDVIKLVQETETMRALAGLKRLNTLKNGFYIPRGVNSVKGVLIDAPTDANLKRLFENAEDGVAAGIDYSRDIRAVLENHVKSTYEEIAVKQLTDASAPYGVKSSDLIDQSLSNRFTEAAAVLSAEKKKATALLKGQEEMVGKLSGAAKKSAETRLEKMRAEAADKIADLEKSAAPTFKEYQNAVRNAAGKGKIVDGKLFGKTADKISVKSWRSTFYPSEDTKLLQMAVDGLSNNHGNVLWRSFDRIGNTTRYLASVGDFAAPFVQGLPVLARDPVAWARSSTMHYTAWFDPTVQTRFMQSHRATLQKAARYGMAMGDNDFYRGATVGGGFNIDAVIRQLPQGDGITNFRQAVSRQSFGRFQSSYNTFLIQSRIMMWEGMEEGWTKNGGKLSDLAAHINNLTGGLDPRALGITAGQRGIESMWLAFSPRLLRSTFGLIVDLKYGLGHPRGRSAFNSLSRLSTGVVGTFIAAYMTQGINEGRTADEIWGELNPISKKGILGGLNDTSPLSPLSGKKFLSLNINGDWIGVGGQIRAITQLMAGVAGTADSPLDLVSTDFEKNPLVKFWTNRGAPGPNTGGAILEGLTGADPLPYEDIDGLPDIALHLGKSAMPFALQAKLEGENWSSILSSKNLTTTIAGAGGLRASRGTTSEERNIAAQEWNPYANNDASVADMSPEDRARAAEEVQQFGYRGLEEREKIEFDKRNADKFKPSGRMSAAVEAGVTITKAKDTALAEFDAAVQADPYNKRMYAEWRGDIMKGSAWARNNTIEFEEGFEPDSTQGKARAIYFEELKAFSDNLPGDVLSGDEFGQAEHQAMTRIREELGEAGVSALERHFLAGKTPTEVAYKKAVSVLDKAGYWDMHEDTVEFLNSAAGESRYGDFPFESYTEFNTFIKENAAEEKTVPEKSAAYKLVEKLTNKAKQIRRINNPEMDAMLVVWYGASPLTKASQAIAEKELGRTIPLSSDSPEQETEE